MHNLKDSLLLAVITTYQKYFTWDNGLEQLVGILALTIIWWCILTWWDEMKERRKANDVPDRIRRRNVS